VNKVIEWVVAFAVILFAAATIATIEYCKQLRRARAEYEKAKNVVEDIVLSFNRELRRDSERLEVVAYKTEAIAAKTESAQKRVEDFENRIAPIETQMLAAPENEKQVSALLADISTRVRAFETTQETLKVQMANLGDQVEKLSVLPEIKSEQVIPIKRDKALAKLTDTEITVLETLSREGPKTAPDIKDRVQLSREHTARVMKKLYEEGYVERETDKIPFKYSVKREMEQLLRKPESNQAN